jgi:hypothetical protein
MRTKLSQLKKVLSEEQLKQLAEFVKISDTELKQKSLKSFFTDPLIFDKVKSIHDPAWLAYDIFINGNRYEF